MKGFVDVFLLAVPKKNLAAYRRTAQQFGKIVAEYGALEYREFVGAELQQPKFCTGFLTLYKLKAGEVLITSLIEYRSKAHRNQVNKKLMSDPRMEKMMQAKPLFDVKRMVYGGFETFYKM